MVSHPSPARRKYAAVAAAMAAQASHRLERRRRAVPRPWPVTGAMAAQASHRLEALQRLHTRAVGALPIGRGVAAGGADEVAHNLWHQVLDPDAAGNGGTDLGGGDRC